MSKRLREMRLSRIRAARLESPAARPDLIRKFAEKADDLDSARKSVEDAASLSGGLWLSYLFALFYIGIAAGAVTHKDLLLENPVKLPFLSVELPLVAFFVLAPILFVLSHAYTLMYFVLLAAKAGTFNDILGKKIPDPDAAPAPDISPERAAELREIRLGLRRQLPSNIFVQFLAGPRDIRDGGLGWFLKAVAWISLVIGPVLLLLLLQFQFLPYHLEWVTWVQRVALLADVALLWILWPAVLASRGEIQWPRLWRHPIVTLASLIPIGLAFTTATFPGEWMDELVGHARWIPLNRTALGLSAEEPPERTSFHDLLFNGDHDPATERRKSLFSNTLVLPGFDALEAAKVADSTKLDGVKQTLTLDGRHLESAIFWGADLRKANLQNAHLQGASLYRAKLQGARFHKAKLQGASLFQSKLQCASLNSADLQGAWLEEAQLQGADALGVKLQGASLKGAGLQGAWLEFAQLQGASLEDAVLRGARAFEVELKGASLKGAGLEKLGKEGAALFPLLEEYLRKFEQCQKAQELMAQPNQDLVPAEFEAKPESDSALAANLHDLACGNSNTQDALSIVRGLVKNGRIGDTGSQAATLVEAIVHPKDRRECPVSAVLTKADKAALKTEAYNADKARQAGATPQ
ncbi:pentapeptide repeat-containing protein [Methylocapsa aurea]|uniref:pentapeptide repeat-containing protein n=1 Tax=Methylocapsa aurea TaxID=663610 RepID=UPI00138E338E|nr:pentapeptide repeat-containing protein [Methylocapsa aurea]